MLTTRFHNTISDSHHALWQPSSWREQQAWQQPDWGDQLLLAAATAQIAQLPGIVSAGEISTLRVHIAEAALGHRFLLQGGDCAERFQDCNERAISGKLKILLQMAHVISYGARRPVVRIGRIAGQYAKPRTELTERMDDGLEVPAFRGDNINTFKACPTTRMPNPSRLVQSYHCASATANYIRTLVAAGFTELHNLDAWDFTPMSRSLAWARYQRLAAGLRDALQVLQNVGIQAAMPTGSQDFFVSHEALVLPYEEAMTRFVSSHGRYYNLGAHMLWIGDRTRQLDGAHVEYCRGIGNPIGIKIGLDWDPTDIIALVTRMNPHHEAGKITLIPRLGSQHVENQLPRLIKAIQHAGLSVTWSVDPMHGNTERTGEGRKTRNFERVVSEFEATIRIHKSLGTKLGGIHLEMTNEDVTECLGGSSLLTELDLSRRYETWCDPRLNGNQSLEMAFVVAEQLAGRGPQSH